MRHTGRSALGVRRAGRDELTRRGGPNLVREPGSAADGHLTDELGTEPAEAGPSERMKVWSMTGLRCEFMQLVAEDTLKSWSGAAVGPKLAVAKGMHAGPRRGSVWVGQVLITRAGAFCAAPPRPDPCRTPMEPTESAHMHGGSKEIQ